MTHICVSTITIIGSDNGLSVPSHSLNQCWNIGPLGTNFSGILIEIHTFSFKKMHWKMSSQKWRPFLSPPQCVNANTAQTSRVFLYLCESSTKSNVKLKSTNRYIHFRKKVLKSQGGQIGLGQTRWQSLVNCSSNRWLVMILLCKGSTECTFGSRADGSCYQGYMEVICWMDTVIIVVSVVAGSGLSLYRLYTVVKYDKDSYTRQISNIRRTFVGN